MLSPLALSVRRSLQVQVKTIMTERVANQDPTLEELYPNYDPQEIKEAEETIKRYVTLVWRIYSRLRETDQKIDEMFFKR